MLTGDMISDIRLDFDVLNDRLSKRLSGRMNVLSHKSNLIDKQITFQRLL